MIIQLDDLDPCTVELFKPVASPTVRLLESLPLPDAKFVPSCWSGPVCEVDIRSLEIDLAGVSVFARTCSLYPGMVSLRVDRAVLEISYGAGESRSVTGVQYGLTIGRVVRDAAGRAFLAGLAATHDLGQATGSIRSDLPS